MKKIVSRKKLLGIAITGILSISFNANSALYSPMQDEMKNSIFNSKNFENNSLDFIYSQNMLLKDKVTKLINAGKIEEAIKVLEAIPESQYDKKTQYLLVMAYLQVQQLDKAEQLLAGLSLKDTNDLQFYSLKASLELAKNNIEKAKRLFEKVLELDAKSVVAYSGLAKIAVQTHHLDSAKKYYYEVLNLNKKHVNTYILLAKIANGEKDNAQIEKILTQGLKVFAADVKESIKLAVVLGKYYVKQQQPKKIEGLAQKIVKNNPSNRLALSFLTEAYKANNNWPKLENTLRKIIKLNNEDIAHRLILTQLFVSQKKTKAAIRMLGEVIKHQPSYFKAYMMKVSLLLQSKKVELALQTASAAEKQFPEHSLGLHLRGDIYIHQKQFAKARDSYQQAYQLMPANVLAFKIADTYISEEKPKQTIEWLQQQLVKDKGNISLRARLASAYEQNNQGALAVQQYLLILEKKPNNPLALNNLAWLYHKQRDVKALAFAEKAYQQVPNSASIADTYGVILLATKKNIPKALEVLQQAHKLRTDDLAIRYHLAKAYLAINNKVKAIEELTVIKQSSVMFSEKNRAIKLLQDINK